MQGEVEFDIKPGSTRHTNENTEKQDALLLSQAMMTNPLLNKVEVTKIALEKLGFGHLLDRILRNPQEVAKEQQAAQQAALQARMAEPQLKTQTDMQKTLEKNKTAIETARIKAGSVNQGQSIKAVSDQKDRDTSLLETVLKIAGTRDNNNGGDR